MIGDFLEWQNYPVCCSNDGYMTLCICENPWNFTAKQNKTKKKEERKKEKEP